MKNCLFEEILRDFVMDLLENSGKFKSFHVFKTKCNLNFIFNGYN